MISPLVVIASVQAAVRFYRAGDRALAQKLRDRAMWVPGARFPCRQEEKSPAALRDLVEGQDLGFKEWLEADPSRIGIYRAMLAGDQGAVGRMRLLWTIFKRSVLDVEQDEIRSHEEVLADIEYKEISNWLESEDGPVPPWAAFAISLADIAAGFVAANPQIAVEGSNGRALVGAFASSIGSLIPDDGNSGGARPSAAG